MQAKHWEISWGISWILIERKAHVKKRSPFQRSKHVLRFPSLFTIASIHRPRKEADRCRERSPRSPRSPARKWIPFFDLSIRREDQSTRRPQVSMTCSHRGWNSPWNFDTVTTRVALLGFLSIAQSRRSDAPDFTALVFYSFLWKILAVNDHKCMSGFLLI